MSGSPRREQSLCRERAFFEWQTKPPPHINERFGEGVDELIIVMGRWGDAQTLGAARDGRIVDRLDVDAVRGEQKIARFLAPLRIAYHHRGVICTNSARFAGLH